MGSKPKKILYNITKEGCWNCISHSVNKDGYPQKKIKGKVLVLSRIVYSQYKLNNESIPFGLVIRHTCDNRKCINPDHLLEGTHQDNVQDMVDRCRQSKGESRPTTTLKEKEVLEIFNNKVLKGTELAKLYNVSQKCISYIKTGKSWRWLTKKLI